MEKIESIEAYIAKSGTMKDSLILLRDILLSADLTETVKWGGPVYMHAGKNIAGMAAFKSYTGLWFYQGALLKDEQKKLMNAQEGITKALRQWRFFSKEEILQNAGLIREYIDEAIMNSRIGNTIKADKNLPLVLPPELEKLLISDPVLKASFDLLSLAKKREYAEYVSIPKLPATKSDRLEKIIPMIRRGEGLNDKYKK